MKCPIYVMSQRPVKHQYWLTLFLPVQCETLVLVTLFTTVQRRYWLTLFTTVQHWIHITFSHNIFFIILFTVRVSVQSALLPQRREIKLHCCTLAQLSQQPLELAMHLFLYIGEEIGGRGKNKRVLSVLFVHCRMLKNWLID